MTKIISVRGDKIGEYCSKYVEDTGAELAVYWYKAETYEGNGGMLLLKDGKHYFHRMCHCSCYGPCDYIELSAGESDIDRLLSRFTDELKNEMKDVVAVYKENLLIKS